MQTIQVVLNEELLRATDTIAKQRKLNRSALIREALEEHLMRIRTLELEERDRRGFLAQPVKTTEDKVWEEEAAWPKD